MMMMMSGNWKESRRGLVNVNVPVKRGNNKVNRYLVSVNVVGSAGALRFIVNHDDTVSSVIDAALKSYAREGRLPSLGSDPNNFLLYSATAPSEALSPGEKIGGCGGGSRKFVIGKKQVVREIIGISEEEPHPKGFGWNLKAWLKKTFMISH